MQDSPRLDRLDAKQNRIVNKKTIHQITIYKYILLRCVPVKVIYNSLHRVTETRILSVRGDVTLSYTKID